MHGFVERRAIGPRVVLMMTLGLGCGGPTPTPADGSSGSSSDTRTTTSPGTTTRPMTGVDTTAGVPTSDGTGSTGPEPTAGSTAGPTTASEGTSTGPEPGTTDAGTSTDEGGSSSSGGMPFVCPAGGGMACNAPAECASNACFVVGFLGGVCSECDEDADCAFGCSPGNPLTGDCALCCDGSLGCGCETVMACQAGLACAQLLDVPGIITQSTCSECANDLDCAGGELCAPSYDLSSLGGQFSCVPPMSLPNGEGCDIDGSGDMQCTSGNCAQASIMGIPVAGICSVCDEDADCGAGSCVLPQVAIAGMMLDIIPGVCV